MENTNQPQVQSTDVQTQKTPFIKTKAGIATIVGITALIAVAGGFYLYKSNKTDKQDNTSNITPTPTVTATASVTPATGQTSDWEVYKNTEYGIEFKHPKLKDCCNITTLGAENDSVQRLTVLAVGNVTEGTDMPFSGIGLYVAANEKNLGLNAYVNSATDRVDRVCKNPSDITVGGIKGLMVSCDADNYGMPLDVIYLPIANSNKFLLINNIEAGKGTFKKTFDLILTTFKL